ncbi:MAG: DDE-type integrase/transposase/recombinase [Chloroflexi bacterium]|nr:DDE-type integrase/transposase/recombinase [Chloroflexota bacterium]
MYVCRFSVGQRFRWRDTSYEVKRILSDQQVNLESIATGEMLTVSVRELVKDFFDGKLYFSVAGQRKKGEGAGEASRPSIYADLADCPPDIQAIVRWRWWVIEPLVQLGKRRTVEDVRRRVAQVKAHLKKQNGDRDTSIPHTLQTSVSFASVYRWVKDYEASGGDVRALIPRTHQRNKGKRRLSEAAEALTGNVIEELYLQRERFRIEDVWHEVGLRVDEENRFRTEEERLEAPSRRTVARRIEAMGMANKLTARRGRRAAAHELKQVGKMARVLIPLAVVQIDHTTLDIIIVDPVDRLPIGRPVITLCIDVATRYPLGFYIGFEPAGYLTVMECLYHAIRPKPDVRQRYGTKHDWIAFGQPVKLITDDAPEFVGRDLEDACWQLGIVLDPLPPGMPEWKPEIERFFRTQNTGLVHQQSGTTFSNPQDRGDYDSVGKAHFTPDEFLQNFYIFIVDVYVETYHRGLKGVPARRWEAALKDTPPACRPTSKTWTFCSAASSTAPFSAKVLSCLPFITTATT